MSQFDVAAGITKDAIDSVIVQLFANPIAQKKIFSDTITKSLSGLGDVTLSYKVNAAPTVDLTAPSAELWNKAVNPSKAPLPLINGFQFNFSDITGSVSMNKGPAVTGDGAMSLFGELVTTGASPYLQVDAVYMDESSFSGWDKFIVNQLLIPEALKMANKVLGGISIPAIPTMPDLPALTFQPVILRLIDQQVVAAASLTSSPAADLTGFVAPPKHLIYILVGSKVPNVALAGLVKGKNYSKEDKTGPDGWYAAYSISVTVEDITVDISKSPFAISMTIDSPSARGEIGGVGVGITKAVLCPIGAAVDAIAHPGDWDKVIATFSVKVSPSPLPIPVTVALTDGSGGEEAQVSVQGLDKISVVAQPTWSGSITGSTLAAASSALIDMMPGALTKLIVNDIITKNFQNQDVYTIPPLSKEVEGITIGLSAVAGEVQVYDGMLVQELTTTIH